MDRCNMAGFPIAIVIAICLVVLHHTYEEVDPLIVMFWSRSSDHRRRATKTLSTTAFPPRELQTQVSPCPNYRGCDPNDSSKIAICTSKLTTVCVHPNDAHPPNECGCCQGAVESFCSAPKDLPPPSTINIAPEFPKKFNAERKVARVEGKATYDHRDLQTTPCPDHNGCDPNDPTKIAVCRPGCLIFPGASVCVIPSEKNGNTCGCCDGAVENFCSDVEPTAPPTSSPSEPRDPIAPTTCFQNLDELKGAINIYYTGNNAQIGNLLSSFGWPMGDWCVSNVASFQGLFEDLLNFNLDISGWDTSHVTDMSKMFSGASSFNKDLKNWNTSSVTTMRQMFNGASSFNADLSAWNVAKVKTMQLMFFDAMSFNADISSWDISSVTDMQVMLNFALAFNQDLCPWGPKLQLGATVGSMFTNTSCANKADPVKLDYYATPLCRTCPPLAKCFESKTELHAAVDFYMINSRNDTETASIYGWPIGSWCVSAITDFSRLFSSIRNPRSVSFNEDLSSWDVSSSRDMSSMFEGALAFSSNLSAWDVSRVHNMSGLFGNSETFNSDLSQWDVASVQDMSGMFFRAHNFNSGLSSWDVSSVQFMSRMFFEAEQFGQNLCAWGPKMTNIVDVTVDVALMFDGSNCLNTSSPDLLFLPVTPLCSGNCFAPTSSPTDKPTAAPSSSPTDRPTTAPTIKCFDSPAELEAAVAAYIVDKSSTSDTAFTYGWPIGTWCVSAVTDFSSLFAATTHSGAIRRTKRGRKHPSSYSSLSHQGIKGGRRHPSQLTAPTEPQTTPKRTPEKRQTAECNFKDKSSTSCRLVFNEDISNWDVSSATTMSGMFEASSFNSNISSWDVSSVQDMSQMFMDASSFNSDLSSWNVNSVQDMSEMFWDASSFNADLSSWDVSSVQDMGSMFLDASSFNSDLSSWNVNSVQAMDAMFNGASTFNSDLSSWDVASIQSMSQMFAFASAFNSDLSSWNVSSVQFMDFMFYRASTFNSDISSWDVSSARYMSSMFYDASSFDSDLSSWDVSSVQYMGSMFSSASSFNSDLSRWNVSSVQDMRLMFQNASSFNQNLCTWGPKLQSSVNVLIIFSNSKCPNTNSPDLLSSPVSPLCANCPN